MRSFGEDAGYEIVEEIGCLDNRFYDVCVVEDSPHDLTYELPVPCLDYLGEPHGEPLFSIRQWRGEKWTRFGIFLSESEMDRLVELYLSFKETHK